MKEGGGGVTVNDFRLKNDEIAKRARMAVQDMGTKTSSAEIKDIAVIMRSDIQPASRVAEDDTIMYSVNFADDNGFVLMSTDKRVPVLAMAEQGNFYGHTDNPGLQLFLDRSEDYIKQTIEQEEAHMDSLANELKNTPVTDNSYNQSDNPLNTKTQIYEYYTKLEGPEPPFKPFPDAVFTGYFEVVYGDATIDYLDPVIKVEWGQSSQPFNRFFDYCFMSTIKQHPAGCSTVALAQIFSHFEQPKRIEDPRSPRVMRDIKWVDLKASPWAYNIKNPDNKEFLGLLFRVIANKTKTTETCDGTWATDANVKAGLKSFNYTCDNWSDYNYNGAVNSMKAGRPVLIGGFSCDLINGHYWVLDGYKVRRADRHKYEVWSTNSVPGGTYTRLLKVMEGKTTKYIYCNWGYIGQHNGYYAEGVWTLGNSTALHTRVTYDTYVDMMTNIRY